MAVAPFGVLPVQLLAVSRKLSAEAQQPLRSRCQLTANGCRYQLAFRTPGIMPNSDSSRKQMRQSPNRRRNARERPHRPQRLCCRTANLGFRLLFSIMALRAIVLLSPDDFV